MRQQRLQTQTEYERQVRNEENPEARQERLQMDAAHHRELRLPDQLERQAETPDESQQRRQQEFEDRESRRRGNKKACKISAIFSGNQLVKEHYIGSTKTNRGTYTNKCQDCNAIRYPRENESICCQKGKVKLPRMPEPPPILKALLEGQDQRSKVFKKYIIPINNALAMASMKVKYKKQPQGNSYKPSVIIQGKVYYYFAQLEVEEGQVPKFASLYAHDPTLVDTARKNNLYLPKDTPVSARRICESILHDLQKEVT